MHRPSPPEVSTPSLPAQVGYLGPPGSWTHQACRELFGGRPLVPLERQALFTAYETGTVDRICVPVSTSLVGATPYLADVLALPACTVVAEYHRMLGYSLLATAGATLAGIRSVIAHPVALEEARPWLDHHLPHALREPAASGGAAAQAVAARASPDCAALGPGIAATLHGLQAIAQHIEEGPHNVTRWWVLGRSEPAATGHDRTSLTCEATDAELLRLQKALASAGLKVLAVQAAAHRHVLDIEGHAYDAPVQNALRQHPCLRWLGSYAHRPMAHGPDHQI